MHVRSIWARVGARIQTGMCFGYVDAALPSYEYARAVCVTMTLHRWS